MLDSRSQGYGKNGRDAASADPEQEVMKPAEFEAKPEFANFKVVMGRVLAVPKAELEARVERAKQESPRNGDRHAPGRKRRKRKRINVVQKNVP